MARHLLVLPAAATSVRRPRPVRERQLVPRSEAERYAAAAFPLLPAAGAAQFESVERLQAVPVPAHFFAEAVPAHFFAEVAALAPCSAQPKAQRSAAPEALAERAVASLPEESAARDAAAEPPRVAEHAEVAPEAALEAAAWVAAAVQRLEAAAARVAAEVLQPGAAAVQAGVAEGVLQPGARDVAEVQRPAAPGARVRAPARPSVALSVFRRDQLHRRPAPSPAARFARAMASLRIASP